MPHNNAADPGVKPEQTATATTAVTPEAETQSTNISSSSLMDRLEIPAEAQKELIEKQEPVAETAPESETTTAETPEAESETPETPAEPEASTEQPAAESDDSDSEELPKPNKDWPPEVQAEFTKRVGKEARKRRKEREAREEAEEKIEQLQAQLENVQPVTVAPHSGDLLANVHNEQQLAQVVEEARVSKDWCLEHLGTGFTVNEGKEDEVFISPKEIGQKLALIEDVLTRQAPRKQSDMGQKRQYDVLAKQHYPAILDKGSEDYQVGAALMQQLPGLATHPARHLILGDYINGVRSRLAKANGNGKHKDLPAELQRPIPPIAPPVPAARSNGSAPSLQKKKTEAMNNLVEAGGDRDALVRAIRELRKAANNTSHLVSV